MRRPPVAPDPKPAPVRISLVVPFWSVEAIDPAFIRAWAQFPCVHEVILAGPPNSTIPQELMHQPGISLVRAKGTGRGIQLNAGASAATGSILLFQHLDTVLTPAHLHALIEHCSHPLKTQWIWGAFHRKFDHRHPGLRWLEKPERLHLHWFGTVYGDQSVFVRRDSFLQAGGFADIPLMEDVEFSRRMRPVSKPLLLDPPISTSPRRHLEHGPWKTTFRNLMMIARFRLGACPHKLHAEYYRSRTRPERSRFGPALLACVALSLAAPTAHAATAEPWEPGYARLLQTYATPSGIRYDAWHANPKDLESLATITRQIAANGPAVPSREGKLAYYLNAYNIWMLHEVLQAYPVASVREIAPLFGVFTGKRIEVAGERMSLNHLEKQIIIPVFKEPRIHFALNCASASCPPLLPEPFTAARLDSQLQQVTKAFLAQPGPHSYQLDGNNRLRVSKIFDWYRKDFEPPGILPFINRYRAQPLDEKARVSFLDYDWTLNQAR